MITVSVVTLAADLAALVGEINRAHWDDANDMSEYDVASLSAYLARQDTIFIACHDTANVPRTLLGIASARIEVKPYAGETWMYVDEIDVCVDQRRKGAGRAMMQHLIALATEYGCEEVWLGAGAGDDAANGLYRSLEPDDVSELIGYTYDIEPSSRYR